MFISYYYLFFLLCMVVISLSISYQATNSNKIKEINSKIKEYKNKERIDYEEQKQYIDLIGEKEDIQWTARKYNIGLLFYAVINILIFKGLSSIYFNFYFFELKIGLLFILCYMGLLGLIFNKLIFK